MIGTIDYSASAELYATATGKLRGSRYLRFDSFAEALRFAVEQLPREALRSLIIEAGDERYDGKAVQALYEAPAYPLARPAT